MLKTFVLGAAAVLALSLPASAALAHDDDGYDYGDWQHAQDHAEHGDYHADEAYGHALAHAEGFYSPEEHREWHERAARAHREFHEDHPNTWHDHYDGGYYGGGYGSYSGYNGYGGYGQYYSRPSVSVWWGSGW